MGSILPISPVSLPPTGFLEPTWRGFIFSTRDALLIFEACLRGDLNPVPRRPHDRERADLVRSGCVFVYMETDSGIKRWTDGIPWSPSRILGNFLIYRELEKAFGPGEKKRALKHGNKRANRPGEPYPRREDSEDTMSPSPRSPQGNDNAVNEYPLDRNNLRALIGSLTDSYAFRDHGLVKKTITVKVEGINYHLVSYYTISDVQSSELKTPSESNQIFNAPRRDLWDGQNFRNADVEKYDPISVTYQNLQSPFVPPHYPYQQPPSYNTHRTQLPNIPSPGQSYGESIYRTPNYDHTPVGEHAFPTSPMTSERHEVYHRNINMNQMGMKIESQNYGLVPYHGSESTQAELPSSYEGGFNLNDHTPRLQNMHYAQSRLPPLQTPALRDFGQVQPKQEHVEYPRHEMASQAWQQPTQTDGVAYQDDRNWAGNRNEYSSDIYRDPGNEIPWHPPQR